MDARLKEVVTFLNWLAITLEAGKNPANNVIKLPFYLNSHLCERIIYHVDTTYDKVYFYTEGYELYLGMATSVNEAVRTLAKLVSEEIPNGCVTEYRKVSEENLQKAIAEGGAI